VHEEIGTLKTFKQHRQNCTLLADAYFILSKIQASTATPDLAIENATNALQILKTCINVFQDSEIEEGHRECYKVPLYPPPPEMVVFHEIQYNQAHQTYQVQRYLAYLNTRKGSWDKESKLVLHAFQLCFMC
jgi:hypothetical protein